MPAILVLKVRVLLLTAAGSSSKRTCQDHTQDKAANEANEWGAALKSVHLQEELCPALNTAGRTNSKLESS